MKIVEAICSVLVMGLWVVISIFANRTLKSAILLRDHFIEQCHILHLWRCPSCGLAAVVQESKKKPEAPPPA